MTIVDAPLRTFCVYRALPCLVCRLVILNDITANGDFIITKPGNKGVIAISALDGVIPVVEV